MFWTCFAFYYAIGFYVALYIVDEKGNQPPLWHVPLIALVWPACFVLVFDE